MTNKQIRVRLRHAWVTLMAFPLTEEQAAALAAGDRSDLSGGPLDMEFTPAVCQRCQLNYDEAPYTCPGEPTAFAPDGDPLFH
jgi:hypothetical protein